MLQVYRYLTYFIFPLLVILIYFRSFFNKEDKFRFKEKIFSSNFKANRENSKKLIWFHAASIGECLSILPLVNELGKNNKSLQFLITTVTLSSSKLLEKKLSNNTNISHRFFPLDLERLSEKFLKAWKPDLVCFVDSEIWPNFLFKIKEKKIPLLLLNARITKKSLNRWTIVLSFAKKVFNNFDLCLPASNESKNNLKYLEVKNFKHIGNLKYSVESTYDKLADSNKKVLDNYNTWCAASTHNGEEHFILKTHLEIKKKYSNILTIIIPRHVDRAVYIKNLSDKFNLKTQILNENDLINSSAEILIINSFGVMPKYFNYCKNIFIGKSLIKEKQNVSGQNPIEAAKSGCKIFHGPYVYNFQEVYELLRKYDLAEEITKEQMLAEKIIESFKNPKKINYQQVDQLNRYGKKILEETTILIERHLK
ncbi:MAG: 3-deoxy-D-manno-octulosonic acid transferase [Pelagibacteraceae bacterium]|nr:3-deoxy-D-manno-octulosonic acid transferase [Pelagibacteraceae bacterium]